MTDAEFVDAFESLRLPAEDFPHREHVRLAWLYLRDTPLLEAVPRFVSSLRRFAEHHGSPNLYHETITWAFLMIIHDRVARGTKDGSWSEFAAANEDLFRWKPSILDRFYNPETLQSDLARRTFLFPDRTAE
jgi:hypothetical protein